MKFALSLVSVIGLAQANYKSGSVQTNEQFTYGKFKAHMKAPDRKGTVCSFYTFWDGPDFYANGWNEIDMNIVPSQQNPLSTSAVYGNGSGKKEDQAYARGKAIADEWHTYEMEWTPDHISYSVDGQEIRRLTNEHHEAVNFMHKAQHLKMNFWTSEFHGWGDSLDPVDMPWYLLIDWVEVYNYNPFTHAFDFHWRDDFNLFDQTRWEKNSGTFEGSSTMFYPTNVSTYGGNLVLKMEPAGIYHPLEHDHYPSHLGFAHHEHEYGALIHHAIPDIDLPKDYHHSTATLGHLMPTTHYTLPHLPDPTHSRAEYQNYQELHQGQPEAHNLHARFAPNYDFISHRESKEQKQNQPLF